MFTPSWSSVLLKKILGTTILLFMCIYAMVGTWINGFKMIELGIFKMLKKATMYVSTSKSQSGCMSKAQKHSHSVYFSYNILHIEWSKKMLSTVTQFILKIEKYIVGLKNFGVRCFIFELMKLLLLIKMTGLPLTSASAYFYYSNVSIHCVHCVHKKIVVGHSFSSKKFDRWNYF